MKLSWRKKRIIRKYLERKEKYRKAYPELKGFNGVTMIRYGYMLCKMITVEMIEFYKNILEKKLNKKFLSW